MVLQKTVDLQAIALKQKEMDKERLKATIVALTNKLNLLSDSRIDENEMAAIDQRRQEFEVKIEGLGARLHIMANEKSQNTN